MVRHCVWMLMGGWLEVYKTTKIVWLHNPLNRMTIETRIHGMFQHDKTPVKSIDINCVMISKFHNFSKSFFKGGFENKELWTFPTNLLCVRIWFFTKEKGKRIMFLLEVVWICIKFYCLVVFFSFSFFCFVRGTYRMLLENESSPTLIIFQRRQNDKKKPKIFFNAKRKKEKKKKRKGKEGLSLLKRRKKPSNTRFPWHAWLKVIQSLSHQPSPRLNLSKSLGGCALHCDEQNQIEDHETKVKAQSEKKTSQRARSIKTKKKYIYIYIYMGLCKHFFHKGGWNLCIGAGR